MKIGYHHALNVLLAEYKRLMKGPEVPQKELTADLDKGIER